MTMRVISDETNMRDMTILEGDGDVTVILSDFAGQIPFKLDGPSCLQIGAILFKHGLKAEGVAVD